MLFGIRASRKVAAVVSLAALVVSTVAFATNWTAVPSTGTLDETNSGSAAFTGAKFGYKTGAASINQIQARYNVVNASGSQEQPLAWGTLELGNFDNSGVAGCFVQATLWKVNPCSGDSAAICTVVSTNAAVSKCDTCQFMGGLDFNQYLYYVDVIIDRTAAAQVPTCNSLRIY